jgi:predicted mannosyl-3-phosphoglycerate phosphatase (HAD superfamily)
MLREIVSAYVRFFEWMVGLRPGIDGSSASGDSSRETPLTSVGHLAVRVDEKRQL